jgi:molybdate transport system ATP-binding protein
MTDQTVISFTNAYVQYLDQILLENISLSVKLGEQ